MVNYFHFVLLVWYGNFREKSGNWLLNQSSQKNIQYILKKKLIPPPNIIYSKLIFLYFKL